MRIELNKKALLLSALRTTSEPLTTGALAVICQSTIAQTGSMLRSMTNRARVVERAGVDLNTQQTLWRIAR